MQYQDTDQKIVYNCIQFEIWVEIFNLSVQGVTVVKKAQTFTNIRHTCKMFFGIAHDHLEHWGALKRDLIKYIKRQSHWWDVNLFQKVLQYLGTFESRISCPVIVANLCGFIRNAPKTDLVDFYIPNETELQRPPHHDDYCAYDSLLQTVIIGDTGTGKSCLVLRFADEMYTDRCITTIGYDFKTKYVQRNDKTYKLQIWDTTDQEQFKTVGGFNHLRGAHCIVICFDVTNFFSFNNVSRWLRLANCVHCTVLLVGCKCDLRGKNIGLDVPKSMIREFCNEFNLVYFETSSKYTINVSKVFLNAIKSYLVEPEEEKQSVEVGDIGVDTPQQNGYCAVM